MDATPLIFVKFVVVVKVTRIPKTAVTGQPPVTLERKINRILLFGFDFATRMACFLSRKGRNPVQIWWETRETPHVKKTSWCRTPTTVDKRDGSRASSRAGRRQPPLFYGALGYK